MIYDIIGDVHGHADRLVRLLSALGYRNGTGVFAHRDRERQAVFLGDFIDRGPGIRETLAIVRPMIDEGKALSVMGNHEYNAVCFACERRNDPGKWMRSRNDVHIDQHLETLIQFRGFRREWAGYLEWFKGLPFSLDLGEIRVVHACWDRQSLNLLGNVLTDDLLGRATVRGTPEFEAIQIILKGAELKLPEGITFTDKDGHIRDKIRVKWWSDEGGKTYSDLGMPEGAALPKTTVPEDELRRLPFYGEHRPVFFGHYWLVPTAAGAPLSPVACCLDYSVADRGPLAAYTWRGEHELIREHMSFA